MNNSSGSGNLKISIMIVLGVTLAVHGLFAWRTLSQYEYHPSAFIAAHGFYFNPDNPNSKLCRNIFRNELIVMAGGGYDAGYYYLVASNLSGRDACFRKAYFHHRILLPLLMYGLSAGDQAGFPIAFYAISLFSTLAAAGLFGVYFSRRGISPYLALGVSLFPGMIINTLHVGVESLSLGFAAAALLLCDDGDQKHGARLAGCLVCLLLAMLSKETAILFALLLGGRKLLSGAKWSSLVYLLPVILYFAWTKYADAFLVAQSDYGTREAFAYNYSAVPFAGIKEWVTGAFDGTRFASYAFIENLAAPVAFLLFCVFTGATAVLGSRRHGFSVFLPLSVVLMLMIPFCREPLLNLYSCLRVFLPVVVCFIILVNEWRPRARVFFGVCFVCAVFAADLFLFFKPAASHYLFKP